MAAWLVGCDAWVKITARVATCPSTPSVGEAAGEVWSLPTGCGDTDFWGIARLSPTEAMIGGDAGMGVAVGLLVLATVVSVLVIRWRWRTRADAAALGVLWGAAIVGAVPRLLGGGTGLAELQLGGMPIGLGDLGLLWAALWLGWRAVAEARA
ncbi:hypothetical protein OEB96_09300 [Paraliomyxa miuraensis]|nr:hypothetical protein [Paraliomyxa miuraensis]